MNSLLVLVWVKRAILVMFRCLRRGALCLRRLRRLRPTDRSGAGIILRGVRLVIYVMIVAGVQAGAARLQGKAQYRKTGGVGGMLGLYPAGAASLAVINDRDKFAPGEQGDEQWYEHAVQTTSTFTESNRAGSTAREHEMYMKNISDWVESMGFKKLVEKAEADDANKFGCIKLVYDGDQPRVIRPEMIISMMSLMSVGDPRAPKNLKLVQKAKRDAEERAGTLLGGSAQPISAILNPLWRVALVQLAAGFAHACAVADHTCCVLLLLLSGSVDSAVALVRKVARSSKAITDVAVARAAGAVTGV